MHGGANNIGNQVLAATRSKRSCVRLGQLCAGSGRLAAELKPGDRPTAVIR
jgi:hypothetical protein